MCYRLIRQTLNLYKYFLKYNVYLNAKMLNIIKCLFTKHVLANAKRYYYYFVSILLLHSPTKINVSYHYWEIIHLNIKKESKFNNNILILNIRIFLFQKVLTFLLLIVFQTLILSISNVLK